MVPWYSSGVLSEYQASTRVSGAVPMVSLRNPVSRTRAQEKRKRSRLEIEPAPMDRICVIQYRMVALEVRMLASRFVLRQVLVTVGADVRACCVRSVPWAAATLHEQSPQHFPVHH